MRSKEEQEAIIKRALAGTQPETNIPEPAGDDDLLTPDQWRDVASDFSEKIYARLSPGLRPWLAENHPEILARIHQVEAKLDSMARCAMSELIDTLKQWQSLHLEGERLRTERKAE